MHTEWSDEAQKTWQSIPREHQEKIEGNVWCSSCRGATAIIGYSGRIVGQSLVLTGTCAKCGQKVVRVVEELIKKPGR